VSVGIGVVVLLVISLYSRLVLQRVAFALEQPPVEKLGRTQLEGLVSEVPDDEVLLEHLDMTV
jgi:hypothetical protein